MLYNACRIQISEVASKHAHGSDRINADKFCNKLCVDMDDIAS